MDLSRLRDVLGLLATKWSVRVLEALCTGPRRFGEITRQLDEEIPARGAWKNDNGKFQFSRREQ